MEPRKAWVGLVLALGVGIPSAAASPATMARVSLADDAETSGASGSASISAGGRFVAFTSSAGNLVPGDTNGVDDVFVRDVIAGTTERVSVASDASEANGASGLPDISADGRYAIFRSAATNLGGGSGIGIYLRDRVEGTTELVSIAPDGEEPVEGRAASISADGMRVAFDARRVVEVDGGFRTDYHVYVRDRAAGSTVLVSKSSAGVTANNASGSSAISADGTTVAFVSRATNLAPGTSLFLDRVYVHDLAAATTEVVSVATSGARANDHAFRPALSGDGRLVVFVSAATNLANPDLFVLAPHREDIFLHDRRTDQTRKLSVTPFPRVPSSGYSAAPAISADGTTVVFSSSANNLAYGEIPDEQVWREFLEERINGTPRDLSRHHVYVVRVASGRIWRLSSRPDGSPSEGTSSLWGQHAVSADGRFVVFTSTAQDLGPQDENEVTDVYLVDRGGCPEHGAASEVIDGVVERRAGPAAAEVDDVNCDRVVAVGL